MGLASTKNISIHHVHIPRTGGTYINELFKMNDLILDYFWGTEWPNTDEMILSEKVDEIEPERLVGRVIVRPLAAPERTRCRAFRCPRTPTAGSPWPTPRTSRRGT